MKAAELLRHAQQCVTPATLRALGPAVATLAAATAFAAIALWSARVLRAPEPPAPAAPAQPAPFDTAAGSQLFGSKAGDDATRAPLLLGVLSFDGSHGAAIVGIGGEPPRVVRIGGALGQAGKLVAVRARSIVIDRDGLRREIALPAATNPNAFVR
ncbi:general secretion pathway protein GspC [Burkholderia plantarii]|uniref:General secretion pathway protein C n=1 Tax=Burkholderia plantarii TaxID=41899 RepID=A0A0B6SCR6_BURPL|nr:general secretion pathway protein GspC [Burkholderia plantarii]AJK50051.1 general secretion pathway protein C [Burkholderia plantarii]